MDFRSYLRKGAAFYERQPRGGETTPTLVGAAAGIVDSTVVRDFSGRNRCLGDSRVSGVTSRRLLSLVPALTPSISVRLPPLAPFPVVRSVPPRRLSRALSPYRSLTRTRWSLATSISHSVSSLPRPRRAFFFSPPLPLRFASAPSLSGSHYLLITSYLVTCYPFARRSILLRANRVHASVLTRTF